MLKEFKEFALRGNVVDLAVGLVLGAAFGAIVTSAVNDVLMPPLGLVVGGVDFTNLFVVLRQGATTPGPYASLEAAREAGAVTVNYGVFANRVVSFAIVAAAVFVVVRTMNRLKRVEPPPPAAPPRQEVLLEEIRDLLRSSTAAPR